MQASPKLGAPLLVTNNSDFVFREDAMRQHSNQSSGGGGINSLQPGFSKTGTGTGTSDSELILNQHNPPPREKIYSMYTKKVDKETSVRFARSFTSNEYVR